MTLTSTGIAFSISSIGLAFCGIRFYEAFKKMGGSSSGRQTGILLSIFYLSLSLQHAILAIGGLFFANSPETLYVILSIDHILLGLITALGMYLMFYIFFPRLSPWPATYAILILGIFVAWLTVVTHPLPFVTEANNMDWNLSYQLKIWTYLLLVINTGLPFVIFSRNFFFAKTRQVKNISLIIMSIHFLGIINISILFNKILAINEVKNEVFNTILIVIGLLFIVAFLIMPLIMKWKIKKIEKQF